MLHVRVISPTESTDAVVRVAVECPAVVNVVRLSGAAVDPVGDCVEFDVAREGANEVLAELRALGLKETGAITVEEIDLTISDGADAAEEAAPGHSEDAVIWEELAARTAAETRLSWSYLVFLALAVQIAAIGALLDQPILIVGAMVLGPDFGPVAAFCFGALQRDLRLAGRAAATLLIGFAIAIAVTLACAAVSRGFGWIESSMLDDRPLTSFIVHPDRWSFIVAVLAGVAGILSMTARKSQALVGVFISVTTVPAAGNIAVAIALAHWHEVGASLVQLGVNLAGLVIAGIGTLLVQRIVWSRFELRLMAPARNTADGLPARR
ncbi:DUF389 domain-containing protein [Glycomyces dulcitolivorans]|uniref:DUF389 domain-containing protein n=1 Tax=Glycomyces dulcitolivorans TaxID=2200759 RepID=UPI000DD446F8|nr:DUF389 domain-containing protein [Glycomyces dulcitolivorans]